MRRIVLPYNHRTMIRVSYKTLPCAYKTLSLTLSTQMNRSKMKLNVTRLPVSGLSIRYAFSNAALDDDEKPSAQHSHVFTSQQLFEKSPYHRFAGIPLEQSYSDRTRPSFFDQTSIPQQPIKAKGFTRKGARLWITTRR